MSAQHANFFYQSDWNAKQKYTISLYKGAKGDKKGDFVHICVENPGNEEGVYTLTTARIPLEVWRLVAEVADKMANVKEYEND